MGIALTCSTVGASLLKDRRVFTLPNETRSVSNSGAAWDAYIYRGQSLRQRLRSCLRILLLFLLEVPIRTTGRSASGRRTRLRERTRGRSTMRLVLELMRAKRRIGIGSKRRGSIVRPRGAGGRRRGGGKLSELSAALRHVACSTARMIIPAGPRDTSQYLVLDVTHPWEDGCRTVRAELRSV